jgi:GTP-binding protein
MSIRNLAIIAHVDHGKTTLIDGLFHNAGVFDAHKDSSERVMDSGELEKERGITITAKNAAFRWNDVHINIVDTPGHADFGGEVERALYMVDGALLLVDAAEGPLPQTRFVLRKAFEHGATDESQVSYTTVYASAKNGWASLDRDTEKNDFSDLLNAIVKEVPAPKVSADGPFQMLVTNLTYSSYLGQIAVGRIASGKVVTNDQLQLIGKNQTTAFKATAIESYSGLSTARFDDLEAGTIALIAGAPEPRIGDTIATAEGGSALPRIEVEPPTVSVRVSINTSPLAGTEGQYATTRKLQELLETACMKNVALEFESTDSSDVFLLKARGELAIVILMEQFRREGWEFMVGRPEIIGTEIDGQLMEPLELLTIDIPDTMVGVVTPILSERGGRMESMTPQGSRVRLEFAIPARGLIGLRSVLLTETRGEAIWASALKGYVTYQGQRFNRANGALVVDRPGKTTEYALHNLQARGKIFIGEGTQVYEGMVFGEHSKANDLNCNACVEKKLTNVRASGSDDSTRLKGFKGMEIDEAIEWIDEDEWVEVTPENIRIRKHELDSRIRPIIRR